MNNATRNRTLITGASEGIGKEFAFIFAKEGYDLILVSRDEEKLVSLKRDIEKKYRVIVTIYTVDLSKADSAAELFHKINNTGTEVNVLINNAGFGKLASFEKHEIQEFLEMIQVNVTTLTLLTRLFLPEMIKRNKGWILNVASTAAFLPGPLMPVYYATKAYVLSLSEALNRELKDTGVQVSTLCPGPTKTQFQIRAGIINMTFLDKVNALPPSKVAEAGYKGLIKRKSLIIPGTLNKIYFQLLRLMPRKFMKDKVFSLQKKRMGG